MQKHAQAHPSTPKHPQAHTSTPKHPQAPQACTHMPSKQQKTGFHETSDKEEEERRRKQSLDSPQTIEANKKYDLGNDFLCK